MWCRFFKAFGIKILDKLNQDENVRNRTGVNVPESLQVFDIKIAGH
jgi:hypothetical protein